MRIVCIQLCTGQNYTKNLNCVLKLIKKSVEKKADLIITPEATSILSNDTNKILKYSFSMKEDPLIQEVKKISLKNKKWILIGSLFIKDKKDLKNRSILINPKGKIQTYYDKINMFDVKLSDKETYLESKNFKAGKELKIAKLPWGNLGFSICYDLRFPELFRDLSQKKLNFISVPSAFTKTTGKHWLTLLKARAIENFCYIFAPAQTGKNHYYRETFGHSVIISPNGDILKIKKKGVGLIYSDIDPKLSMQLRQVIPSIKKYK